jgi:hypothetical protein
MPLVPLLALFLDAFEGTPHELPFQGSNVVDEQLAIEVVDLVLQDSGVETFGVELEGLAVLVQGGDVDVRIARHIRIELRYAQAALFGGGHTLADVDDGVYQRNRGQAGLRMGHIDDDDPSGYANLGRSKADTFGLFEAVEEIPNQGTDFVVDDGNGISLAQQNFGPVLNDLSNQDELSRVRSDREQRIARRQPHLQR